MDVTPASSFSKQVTHEKANEIAGGSGSEQKRNTILEDNGYETIGQVGVGAYAKVITAYSAKERGIVAIKIISKMNTSTTFLYREVNVVRGLIHPNLIKFYRSIETTHRIYIIMEYAPNGSLLDRVRGETYFTEAKARSVYRQLVDALEYCHNRGVAHRDIKCENILFDENDVVKIIDFGFANSYKMMKNTYSETYCGSRAYCCPEILKRKPYQPFAADIWASGVVLFAMVYGKLPFDDSDTRKMLKQLQSKIHLPSKPNVSSMCQQLIGAILAPHRKRATWAQIKQFDWMTKDIDELNDCKI